MSRWVLLVASGLIVTIPARAQDVPPDETEAPSPDPDAPARPSPAPADAASPAPAPIPPEDEVSTEFVEEVLSELDAVPGGLRLPEARRRAMARNPSSDVDEAQLEAASARVDQALVDYFPRLTVTAMYKRLSPVNNISIFGPCPIDPSVACAVTEEELVGTPVITSPVLTPVFLNQYSVVGSLRVPLSDYVLRIRQRHAAASEAEEAARLQALATTKAAAYEGETAYFTWVASRAQLAVAKAALEQAATQVKDGETLSQQGLASRADLLRLKSQQAASKRLVAETEALADVAETRLRIVTGMKDDEQLELGEDLFSDQTPLAVPKAGDLLDRAIANRTEVSALKARRRALEEQSSAARAGYAPRLEAFANVYVMNPNPRRIPPRALWMATYDLGVQLTWTVNDTFTALGRAAEADAEVRSAEAEEIELQDALRMEVAEAVATIKRANADSEAATIRLEAADEGLRNSRELFAVGEAGALDLIDAATEVTRARLDMVKAQIDRAAAHARLRWVSGTHDPTVMQATKTE